jgi:TonB family protein
LGAVLLAVVPQLVDAQPLPLDTNQTHAPIRRDTGIATANVRISNQSELGSRAHPFTVYLATVHRQIHRFWADGFLAELDHKPSIGRYPLDLVTALAISLKPDGTVNQVSISRGSGYKSFDAAAIEAVLLAAPFPAPPQSIKSPDGNVHVTWLFHRDERQCATDFVSAHMLAPSAKPTPGGPTAASPEGVGGEPGGNSAEPSEICSPPVTSAMNTAGVPDEARTAAERWLSGYHKTDVSLLTGSSAVPFTDAGMTVAEDRIGLGGFYTEMVAPGTLQQESVRYYTGPQIKKLRGSLPRGGEKDNMAFAWIEHGGEDLILILQPACHGWRVSGIDR